MSNQGVHNQAANEDQGNLQSNNPFNQNQNASSYQNAPPSQGQQGYAPPSGPPPRRTDIFKESDYVPQAERGEQREALEQFEMNRGREDEGDRDVETLQQEFPGVDGSLIAALYSDSKSLSATREMLQELASQDQGS